MKPNLPKRQTAITFHPKIVTIGQKPDN